MMTEKQLVLMGNQTDEELLRDHRPQVMKRLPIENMNDLLQHHDIDDLVSFCDSHEKEFKRNVMLVNIPYEVAPNSCGMTIIADIAKRTYSLGERNYVFVSRSDVDHMYSLCSSDRDTLSLFLKQFQGCIYDICHKRSCDDMEQVDEEKDVSITKKLCKQDLREENARLRVALALKEKELSHTQERFNLEREMFQYKIRAQEEVNGLITYQQQQQQQQYQQPLLLQQPTIPLPSFNTNNTTTIPTTTTTTTTTKTGMKKTETVSDWIGPNRYGQLIHDRPVNEPKWFGVFNNPNIDIHQLQQSLRVDSLYNNKFRLVVPLTYTYNLIHIIKLIANSRDQSNHSHIKALVDRCPSSYQVILYATDYETVPRVVADYYNTWNCATLTTHCHFMINAHYMNHNQNDVERKFLTCLNDTTPPRLVPSYDIMDEFFPSCNYFGPNTVMCSNMGIHVKYDEKNKKHSSKSKSSAGGTSSSGTKKGGVNNNNKKKSSGTNTNSSSSMTTTTTSSRNSGVGIGNGKNCPFCQIRERLIKQNHNHFQVAHQTKKCSALATMSNNEVDILMAIMKICQNKDPQEKKSANALKKNRFVFGVAHKAQDKNQMVLDASTLLRHATEEEIASGEHVNGLRLNIPVYMEVRRNIYAKMKQQFEGPLFGKIDPLVATLLYDMDSMPLEGRELPSIISLIYDSDGQPFIDPVTKKTKYMDIESPLFFSFEPQPVSSRLKAYQNTVELERKKQDDFIRSCLFRHQQQPFLPQQHQYVPMGMPMNMDMSMSDSGDGNNFFPMMTTQSIDPSMFPNFISNIDFSKLNYF